MTERSENVLALMATKMQEALRAFDALPIEDRREFVINTAKSGWIWKGLDDHERRYVACAIFILIGARETGRFCDDVGATIRCRSNGEKLIVDQTADQPTQGNSEEAQ